MTMQIQSWVSTGHSIAMSRLLRQGILLSYVQVIHIQMLDSGVIATSCFTLSDLKLQIPMFDNKKQRKD